MTAARAIAALAIAAVLRAQPASQAQAQGADPPAAIPVAQETDSLRAAGARSPSLRLGFERNVNTFTWDCSARYAFREGGWEGAAAERFQRTLIAAEQRSVKDEQLLTLDARRRLLGPLALAASVSSFFFTDNKSLGLSDVSANRFLAGLRWQPLAWWSLQPMAGVAFDRQLGYADGGFSYEAASTVDRLLFGSSAASGELVLSESQLSPRSQKEQRAGARMATAFGAGSENRLQLQLRNTERDFYTESAGALAAGDERPTESRAERSLYAADQLRYQVTDAAVLLAGVEAQQRSIDKRRPRHEASAATPFFDASIDEFRLDGSLDGRLAIGRTALVLRLNVFERNETHAIADFPGSNPLAFLRQQKLEEQKNNRIAQTQLSFGAVHGFSTADSLALMASTVKMTYDTPSAQNADDRDELWFLAGGRYVHRFSSTLTGFVSADVNLRHTVYIFAEQSANNTWNRVLRFSPGTEIRSDALVSKLQGEVVANYTVYDFESPGSPQKSYSLRQLTVADSTSIPLSRRLSLTALLQYRLSERGSLAWTAFTVRPMLLYDERSLLLALTHEGAAVTASAGFRLFLQQRFRRSQAAWRDESTMESLGPVVHLVVGTAPGMRTVLDGWYQRTRVTGGETVYTPELSVGVLWNL